MSFTMSASDDDLSALNDHALADLARAAADELARRGNAEGLGLLIDLSAYIGTAVGESARRVAEQGSWSQVAAVSGTTKQAAWSRWR
jgi:hypothetical protein